MPDLTEYSPYRVPDNLRTMRRVEIHALAKEKGVKVEPSAGVEEVADAIEAAEAKGKAKKAKSKAK